eukprot:3731716-Prorocentrum_lima.AAC.1
MPLLRPRYMPWQAKSHFVKANKVMVVHVEAMETGMELAERIRIDPMMPGSSALALSCKGGGDPVTG